MDAKLRAQELVLKYLRIDNNTKEWFNTHIAKQCALIAVDEIIKSNPIIPLQFMIESEAIDAAVEYWKQVKQEIEKL